MWANILSILLIAEVTCSVHNAGQLIISYMFRQAAFNIWNHPYLIASCILNKLREIKLQSYILNAAFQHGIVNFDIVGHWDNIGAILRSIDLVPHITHMLKPIYYPG